MDDDRYTDLMADERLELTDEERSQGWHFCSDWDGLLIGPGMKEMEACGCDLPKPKGEAMTEFKLGIYELVNGHEVVVTGENNREYCFAGRYEASAGWLTGDDFEDAKYLGPAVIGDEAAEMVIDELKQKLAETEEKHSSCKELLWDVQQAYMQLQGRQIVAEKDRDEYRRKWNEAVEETRRLQQEVDDAGAKLHEMTARGNELRDGWDRCHREQKELIKDIARLKRGDFTDEEFQALCHHLNEEDLMKFKLGCYAYWGKLFGPQSIKYSVDDDGVEWYRFGSVTVAVREGKEAVISPDMNGLSWYLRCGTVREIASSTEEAEAWFRKQLVPAEEWRPATPEDVAGKPECRVRVSDRWDWQYRTLLVHDTRVTSGPWITLNQDGGTGNWPICEVRT